MYFAQMFELLRIPLRQAWLDGPGFRGNLVRRDGDRLVHVDGGGLCTPGAVIDIDLELRAYWSPNWVVRVPSSSGSRDFTDSELTVPWARTALAVVNVEAPVSWDVPSVAEERRVASTGPLFVNTHILDNYFSLYAAQGEEILRLSGDGQLFWRGRLIETDWELVAGLRDLLGSLRTGGCEPPSEIPRLTEWERLRDGADD